MSFNSGSGSNESVDENKSKYTRMKLSYSVLKNIYRYKILNIHIGPSLNLYYDNRDLHYYSVGKSLLIDKKMGFGVNIRSVVVFKNSMELSLSLANNIYPEFTNNIKYQLSSYIKEYKQTVYTTDINLKMSGQLKNNIMGGFGVSIGVNKIVGYNSAEVLPKNNSHQKLAYIFLKIPLK